MRVLSCEEEDEQILVVLSGLLDGRGRTAAGRRRSFRRRLRLGAHDDYENLASRPGTVQLLSESYLLFSTCLVPPKRNGVSAKVRGETNIAYMRLCAYRVCGPRRQFISCVGGSSGLLSRCNVLLVENVRGKHRHQRWWLPALASKRSISAANIHLSHNPARHIRAAVCIPYIRMCVYSNLSHVAVALLVGASRNRGMLFRELPMATAAPHLAHRILGVLHLAREARFGFWVGDTELHGRPKTMP